MYKVPQTQLTCDVQFILCRPYISLLHGCEIWSVLSVLVCRSRTEWWWLGAVRQAAHLSLRGKGNVKWGKIL
jgi:hypothetical protein